MFISRQFLSEQVGVDPEISKFFVDRKVPVENAFWRNRHLYIARGNGYISIPVYYDLLFRIGVAKSALLSETHVYFMEQLMHHAMRFEFKEIGFEEQLREIESMLKDRNLQPDFFIELTSYLRQPVLRPMGRLGKEVPALNRADVFLYILCDLPLSAPQIEDAVKCWYAIHTSYLLIDDIYDYEMDKADNDENAVLELGEGESGFRRAFEILHENMETLRPVNSLLSRYYESTFEELRTS